MISIYTTYDMYVRVCIYVHQYDMYVTYDIHVRMYGMYARMSVCVWYVRIYNMYVWYACMYDMYVCIYKCFKSTWWQTKTSSMFENVQSSWTFKIEILELSRSRLLTFKIFFEPLRSRALELFADQHTLLSEFTTTHLRALDYRLSYLHIYIYIYIYIYTHTVLSLINNNTPWGSWWLFELSAYTYMYIYRSIYISIYIDTNT